MLKYVIRRLLYLPLTLFGIIIITFILVRLVPGEPFFVSERTKASYIANMHQIYGLDLPLPLQFWNYSIHIVQFDFGQSFFKSVRVTDIIWQRFPVSAFLGILAFIIMVVLGVSGGILTGMRQNTWIDHLLSSIALFFYSVPNFVFAFILLSLCQVLINSFNLDYWTFRGWGDIPPGAPPGFFQALLPSLVLGIRPAAIVLRMMRLQIIETKNQDYIRTAYSKGLSGSYVARRHIMRSSLIPVVSLLGDLFGFIIVGTPAVEIVFQIPGLGVTFVNSIIDLDYPVVIGITCFYTFIVANVNLVVDLLYLVLDPRITYGKPGYRF